MFIVINHLFSIISLLCMKHCVECHRWIYMGDGLLCWHLLLTVHKQWNEMDATNKIM